MTCRSDAPCPRCGRLCPIGVQGSHVGPGRAHCSRCYQGFVVDAPPDVHDCSRCGARTLGAPCDCREAAARHEALQLFAPASAQLAGQTFLDIGTAGD